MQYTAIHFIIEIQKYQKLVSLLEEQIIQFRNFQVGYPSSYPIRSTVCKLNPKNIGNERVHTPEEDIKNTQRQNCLFCITVLHSNNSDQRIALRK